MLSFFKNNEQTDLRFFQSSVSFERTSRKSRLANNTFRLAAILCILFIINPIQIAIRPAILDEHDSSNGIGGGYHLMEILSGNEFLFDGYAIQASFNEPASMEAGTLSLSRVLLFDYHIIQRGDNISTLAINHGLNQDSIISVNGITNARLLQVGRVLAIPNQDGILHTVRSGETLASIAETYMVDSESIRTANELFSDNIRVGSQLFIPGARMDWTRLQEINGDLFIWPLRGAVTSGFGYRRDPFNPRRRQFHNGIDIRGRTGTPVRAAMAGRVIRTGFDPVWGNFIIINHHSGYRTLYAHLNAIRTRTGAHVAQGERIGDVGSTGLSTGPHLHFTIFRNGVAINPRGMLR